MRYAVLSPDNQLICFKNSDQVAEYCLGVANHSLNQFCEDQQRIYADMSPTEIGQLYTNVGAVWGECKIYETSSVLKVMKEMGADQEYIDAAQELFFGSSESKEINCPGYLEDVLGELTPLSAAQMTDGIYFMENIASSTEEGEYGNT